MMGDCNLRIQVLIDDILQSLRELSYEVHRQERTIAELRAQIPGGDSLGRAAEPASRPAAVLPAA